MRKNIIVHATEIPREFYIIPKKYDLQHPTVPLNSHRLSDLHIEIQCWTLEGTSVITCTFLFLLSKKVSYVMHCKISSTPAKLSQLWMLGKANWFRFFSILIILLNFHGFLSIKLQKRFAKLLSKGHEKKAFRVIEAGNVGTFNPFCFKILLF